MKIKVIENKTNELKVEIDDSTICEALRKELWEDKTVTQASYSRKNPIENPVLLVQTEGKGAKKALQDALSRLEKKNDDFSKGLKAAVK